MSPTTPTVAGQPLGAWLLKASPHASPVGDLVRTRFSAVTGWCVTPTYRADLVAAGQPVLLWVSGRAEGLPAGIHAQGRTTGVVGDDRLVMPVELEPVEPCVRRTDLLQHPVLSTIEVLRMPAGSNPSFLSSAHLRELRRTWPHVTVGQPGVG